MANYAGILQWTLACSKDRILKMSILKIHVIVNPERHQLSTETQCARAKDTVP